MSGRCEECGASTIWDQDVGSAICVECGTLADPTQSVLTSHLETTDVSGREFAPWTNIPGGSTLRGRNGWALAGQSKEARDRKNTISMHEFIRTLATRLSNPGTTPRAQGIFDQAMRIGEYRWGRKAKLTAGAALAIALRESHKSDSIRDIAYLLDESPLAVSRAFSKTVELLKLNLSSTDPAVHLPTLQSHVVSLLKGPAEDAPHDATSVLPAQQVKLLLPLIPHLAGISHTAAALSALLDRTHTLAHLPTPPTACALFMLALEAELSSSLPNATVFAQSLGARLGAGKGVVMQRYKQIYDLVEDWIQEVPWLDAHERRKAKGREGRGRSKVAKRVVVARGLKDVVHFQEEIWRKRIESDGRPVVQLDMHGSEGAESGDEWDRSEQNSSSRSSRAPSSVPGGEPSKKKVKTRHPKTVVDASHFLLNPLAAGQVPSSSTSPANAADIPDLLTYLLTIDASSLPQAFKSVPSRLQLLASARGGAGTEHIADEELFAIDELEGLMRSPEEAEAVRIAMGWEEYEAPGEEPEGEVDSESGAGRKAGTKGKKRKRSESGHVQGHPDGDVGPEGRMKMKKARGSKKIDMDALARLLDPDADLDAVGLAGEPCGGPAEPEADEEGDETEEEEDEEDDGCNGMTSTQIGAADEEVVEEWRPMSPAGSGDFAAEDWYDF